MLWLCFFCDIVYIARLHGIQQSTFDLLVVKNNRVKMLSK